MTDDTIFALSSGALPAAIAIVRISGAGAADALLALGAAPPPPRRATVAALYDAGSMLLDRALILWFPGPGSATGEDMVELHLHGGRATVTATLASLAAIPGCRSANPGEFTRRAFANGRIDLAQAEGLADLLVAETDAQRRHALRLAEGGLGAMIDGWNQALLLLAAEVEAEIEFGEEGEIGPAPHRDAAIAELRNAIDTALATPPAERLRDGVRIVVAGPPNAGKSTLVNAIADRPVAITTPLAGTTRDLIEAPILLHGIACLLIDSAGLRDQVFDPVEQIGIGRSHEALAAADIILWLGDPSEVPDAGGEVIMVASQCDLVQPVWRHDIAVSGATGENIPALIHLIVACAKRLLPAEDRIALAQRQRRALSAVSARLGAASTTSDLVLLAAELTAARTGLDAVTGRGSVEDMLDTLFGRFCIGK